MPLIDLKTDLKSLKYGKDRPGGGNSGQPYMQTDINTIDRGFNRLRLTNFDDGLIRGGAIGAINSSVVDTIRIGKFLKDFPKGPLFITKQIGLQLSNPRLEFKKLRTDNPTTGGGLLRNLGNIVLNAANTIVNAVGPTRIYNLGINTLAQIPVNAFGGHFNRHGLLPVQNDNTKYIKVVENNDAPGTLGVNNRLVGLKNKFDLGDSKADITEQFNLAKARKANREANRQGRRANRLINQSLRQGAKTEGFEFNRIKYKRQKLDTTTLTIDSYIGGPKSVYGIGRTIINRYNFTEDKGKIDFAKERNYVTQTLPGIKINQTWDFEISTFTNSALSANSFSLTSSEYSASFIDTVALKNDPLNDKYKAIDQEANASAKMRIPDEFVGASKFSGSLLSTTTFPDLTDILNKPTTLIDKSTVEHAINSTPVSHTVIASNALGTGNEAIANYSTDIKTDGNTLSTAISQNVVFYTNASAKTYSELQSRVNAISSGSRGGVSLTPGSQPVEVNRFGIYGKATQSGFSYYLPTLNENPTYYNEKETVQINIPWNKITREIRVGSGRKDSINLTPIFSASTGTIGDSVTIGGKTFNINDLVKFRIQAIDGDNPASSNYMIFRAYLTQLSDNVDSSWNEVKYAGRGDKFYIYDGFSRKIQVGFKVAALSEEEMKPMYQKLNYLMSNTMPDYKDSLMRGPLSKLTVGNWIDGQPGIINSISYTIPQDSPWEISLGSNELILPHIVEVSMTFTPIGSQTQDENKISRRSMTTSNIAQNYNGKVDGINYIG